MESQQYFLTPDLAHRLAAIDIGTNSIRMIVAEGCDGNDRILDDEKEATRLGKNLSSTQRLDPEAVEASLQASPHEADHRRLSGARVTAIAACAVHEAADGREFCRRVQDEVGLEIQVVSADEEARLAFFGVQCSFDLEGKMSPWSTSVAAAPKSCWPRTS